MHKSSSLQITFIINNLRFLAFTLYWVHLRRFKFLVLYIKGHSVLVIEVIKHSVISNVCYDRLSSVTVIYS